MTGTTTILVTDLATSTEMLTAAGDDAGTTMLTAHLRLVRDVVERHGGRVAKTLGDGVMALFDSSYDAACAAIALQQEVDRRGTRDPRPRPSRSASARTSVRCSTRGTPPTPKTCSARRWCSRTVSARARNRGRSSCPISCGCWSAPRSDIAFAPVAPVDVKGFADAGRGRDARVAAAAARACDTRHRRRRRGAGSLGHRAPARRRGIRRRR